MSAKTITLDVPTIMTLEGHPAPVIGEDSKGRMTVTYTAATPEAALKVAKAATRELVKFRLAQDIMGTRDKAVIQFTFDVPNAELPLTWQGKGTRTEKPAILGDVQKALEGYKTTYFNSSVNEGITVEDDRVPVGLQFVYDEEQETIVAKLLKSAKVSGGKTWVDKPLDSVDQAVELVQRLEGILVGI